MQKVSYSILSEAKELLVFIETFYQENLGILNMSAGVVLGLCHQQGLVVVYLVWQ